MVVLTNVEITKDVIYVTIQRDDLSDFDMTFSDMETFKDWLTEIDVNLQSQKELF